MKSAGSFQKSLTRQLDLNLLALFDAVFKAGSLTAAGERLGLSQPAVSYGLARLREAYGDPLFVRVRKGVLPTPFAEGLAATVDAALQMLHGTLDKPTFEPDRAQRAFQVVMSDAGESYFLPRLSSVLQAGAPGVSIQTLSLESDEMADGLASGKVDLAFGFLPSLDKRFHQKALFTERYVYVMHSGHEALKGPLTRQRLRTLRHVIAGAPGTPHMAAVEKVLSGPQLRAPIAMRLQSFLPIGAIVADTDMVGIVPSNLARLLGRNLKVQAADSPVALPAFHISMYWHPRTSQDPGSQWLRDVMVDLFHQPGATATRGRRAPAG